MHCPKIRAAQRASVAVRATWRESLNMTPGARRAIIVLLIVNLIIGGRMLGEGHRTRLIVREQLPSLQQQIEQNQADRIRNLCTSTGAQIVVYARVADAPNVKRQPEFERDLQTSITSLELLRLSNKCPPYIPPAE